MPQQWLTTPGIDPILVVDSSQSSETVAPSRMTPGRILTIRRVDTITANTTPILFLGGLTLDGIANGSTQIGPNAERRFAAVDGGYESLGPDVSGLQGAGGTAGPAGLTWRGVYSNSTTYGTNDAVQYNGAAFIAAAGTSGVNPGTASSPTAPWSLLCVGPQGPAGPGAAGQITPADLGLIAWTGDPGQHQGASGQVNAVGRLYGTRLSLPACSITSLSYHTWVAGASLTTGQNFVALYDISTGNKIAALPDQTTNFGAVGLHTVAVTGGPVAYAGGDVYATFLVNGTTSPYFACASADDTNLVNLRGSGQVIRAGQITSSTGLTALPSTLSYATQSIDNHVYLVVVS